jgi:hypothetical protein
VGPTAATEELQRYLQAGRDALVKPLPWTSLDAERNADLWATADEREPIGRGGGADRGQREPAPRRRQLEGGTPREAGADRSRRRWRGRREEGRAAGGLVSRPGRVATWSVRAH